MFKTQQSTTQTQTQNNKHLDFLFTCLQHQCIFHVPVIHHTHHKLTQSNNKQQSQPQYSPSQLILQLGNVVVFLCSHLSELRTIVETTKLIKTNNEKTMNTHN